MIFHGSNSSFTYHDKTFYPNIYGNSDYDPVIQPTFSFDRDTVAENSNIRVCGIPPKSMKICDNTEEDLEVFVRPKKAPMKGGTNITISGFKPILKGIPYSCRFQDLLVPAVISSDNTLVCKTPPYAVARKISFAISIMMHGNTNLTGWSYDAIVGLGDASSAKSPNRRQTYERDLEAAQLETDLTKDLITFEFVDPNAAKGEQIDCIRCKIGNHAYKGYFDAGTHYMDKTFEIAWQWNSTSVSMFRLSSSIVRDEKILNPKILLGYC